MSDQNKIKIYGELKSGLLNGFLTELEQIKGFDTLIANAQYDSERSRIIFSNTKGTAVASIDAAPFIKDGMVNEVKVENGKLVINFNIPDAAPIEVPLENIFQPDNYFTKEDIENRILVRIFNGFVDNEVNVSSASGSAFDEIKYSRTSNQFCYGREFALNWDTAGSYMNIVDNVPQHPLSGALFYNMEEGVTYFYNGATLKPVIEKDEDVTELMNEVFPLMVKVNLEGAPILEYDGTTHDFTFNVNTSRKGKPVTAESLTYSKDGEVLETVTPTSSDNSYQLAVSKLGKTSLEVKASYNDMTKSGSANVELALPMYYGFGNPEDALANIEGNLTKRLSATSFDLKELEIPESGTHLIIATPDPRRISTILSEGFLVPMIMKEDVRIINEESHKYNFYYSPDGYEAGIIKDLKVSIY